MKIAPNLNFTVVEPTKKSLDAFVQMIKTVYQNFTQAFNGQIGFGDGTNLDNINGSWINVVAPATPNTDFTVNHNLGRVPSGYWAMQKDRACDVYTGSVAATATQLTLRATVGSAVLRLFIIGLLLSLIPSRSAAQGAYHQNTAQKTTTPTGSSGISGPIIQPIAGALITVCNGVTLPAAGSKCTGLANIYSDVTLTQLVSNPTSADINGNYTFFAAAGQNYVISVSGAGVATYSYIWTAPLVGGLGSFTSLTVSGTTTLAGTTTCKIFEGIRCADQFGSTAAVFTDASTTGGVMFPPGYAVGAFSNTNSAPVFDMTNPAWRGYLLASDFGCVGDGAANNVACLNQMIAYSVAHASTKIVFPCGNFFFNSKPNSFGTGIMVEGCATGSTTTSGTFLTANYIEATCSSATNCNGFLTWDGSSGSALGTGGGLRNVTLYRTSNNTAGAAIKLTGADDNHRAGWWRGDHIIVTGAQSPAGTFSYGWLVDGHNNTTSGTQGIRDNACTDCWFTNTTVAASSVYWVNCAKCFWIGGEAFQAGGAAGSAGVTLTGTGGAAPSTADSAENTVMATISGDVVIDQVSNARIISEHVLGNLTITANASAGNFFGRVDGTVSNLSASSVAEVDGVSGTNNTLSNIGGPLGALASGQTPPTQTAGRLYSRESATSGNVMYGDGSCFAGMAAALTFNFNCGNTSVFAFAGTNTQVKSANLVATGAVNGVTGALSSGYDSATATGTYNSNNNVVSSYSGAWNCTNVTPVTVNANVATDQNLMACTIPAGTLNRVGRTLRVKVAGVYSTPAASTSQMTLKIKLCTVSGCGSGTVISPINIQSTALGTVQITNDNFSARSELTTQTAGASSAYEAHGEYLIDLATLATAADSVFGDGNTATVGTIDSTAQLFLQCTFAFSNASASNSATQRQLIAETVN